MGSGLIGTIVSAMLLGVTYMQTFYYYMSAFLNSALREIMNSDQCRLPERLLETKVTGPRYWNLYFVAIHHVAFCSRWF